LAPDELLDYHFLVQKSKRDLGMYVCFDTLAEIEEYDVTEDECK